MLAGRAFLLAGEHLPANTFPLKSHVRKVALRASGTRLAPTESGDEIEHPTYRLGGGRNAVKYSQPESCQVKKSNKSTGFVIKSGQSDVCCCKVLSSDFC